MSWWRNGDRYGVRFNRDEKKSRPRAEPPELRENAFLSPRDPTGGGTWISVNRHGLIVTLLNRWHENQSGTASRGRLVWDLAIAEDTASVENLLESADLSPYPAFTLVAIDSSGEARWDWNTVSLTKTPATAPIVSSSYMTDEVVRHRTELYRNTADQETFHSLSGEGAYSPRMLRPDAQTWSRSHICVTLGEIRWSYAEEFLDFARVPHVWEARLECLNPNPVD